MIIYPDNWDEIGQLIDIAKIEQTIIQILSEIDCNCLSLSGGVDSSLTLYYMTKIWGSNIEAYTTAIDEKHPDYIFSKMIARYFDIKWQPFFPKKLQTKKGDYPGDEIVRAFYNYLNEKGVKEIITCDGIDEYMGGYYAHMENPSEDIYYHFLRKLKDEQLSPLNKNSGKVKIYLPYLDSRLILLLSQIPLKEKFDKTSRKKIFTEMAREKISSTIINRRKYGFCDAMGKINIPK